MRAIPAFRSPFLPRHACRVGRIPIGSPLPGGGFWSEKRVLGGRPGKTRVPSRVSRAGGRLFKERLDWETNKTFRSCQRVENAFCEGVEPPFLMKERARVARDSFCLTVMSCSFHFVISREEFTVPKIG